VQRLVGSTARLQARAILSPFWANATSHYRDTRKQAAMTTTQIEFISVNPGSLLKIHDENRKKVRIQVMKDFRRKERERQGKVTTF
jgi:hypothetical protein